MSEPDESPQSFGKLIVSSQVDAGSTPAPETFFKLNYIILL